MNDKARKTEIRARMKDTGESYSRAALAVDAEHAERAAKPPAVDLAAATAAMASLLADPAIPKVWRPVLQRLADDVAAVVKANEPVTEDDEDGVPIGEYVPDKPLYAARLKFASRAWAILCALAEQRQPEGDPAALADEQPRREPLYDAEQWPDIDDLPHQLAEMIPDSACKGTGYITINGQPSECGCSLYGKLPGQVRRWPEPLEQAIRLFDWVDMAHNDYDDSFGRNLEDCECWDECQCPAYSVPEHMIPQAEALEDEMDQWYPAMEVMGCAVAIVLAGDYRDRLTSVPARA